LVALAVAANIVLTGTTLIRRSGGGLMDRVFPEAERRAVDDALARLADEGVAFHALRTRRSGRRSFVSVHVLVPGDWSVQQGHRLLERIEAAVRDASPGASVFTHLEPVDDPGRSPTSILTVHDVTSATRDGRDGSTTVPEGSLRSNSGSTAGNRRTATTFQWEESSDDEFSCE